MKKFFGVMILLVSSAVLPDGKVIAQKIDEDRMRRDIEVAENVLGTLIKQAVNNQGTFFPLEITGHYQPGYGITFNLPADFTTPIVFSAPRGNTNIVIVDDGVNGLSPVTSNGYQEEFDEEDEMPNQRITRLKDRVREKRRNDMDSMRNAYNQRVIDAAKTFIVDYADIISQLPANEKIVVTNQGNQPRVWVNQYFNAPKRTHIAIEALKADLTPLRQGKMSRDQALSKLKVVNTETVNEVEPDLELLVTMFNRLYRPDLSKTYFTENNIYYERLKDFGVIYYLSVFSGVEVGPQRFRLPTLGLDNVDLDTRNKKVKEMYPKFEQELKDNILEYGRTVKSIKDDEVLIVQVRMTRCTECGIPSSLEMSVKGDVLKDYNSGKLDKNAALAKIAVKKGSPQ